MKWIVRAAAAVAAFAIAGALPAQASEVFEHYGWKGYVVAANEMGGCRMSKRINADLHAIAHFTANGNFLLGFVDRRAFYSPGTAFKGEALFDGNYFSLNGSADNPKLVTFGSGDDGGLMRAFRSSRRMRIEWSGGGWIDMGLQGTKGATDRLRRCAAFSQPRSASPPLTSYAPNANRVLADTDLPGYDYRRLDGIGMDFCVAACASEAICRAVTYNANKWVCFMKSGASHSTYHRGATSWVK